MASEDVTDTHTPQSGCTFSSSSTLLYTEDAHPATFKAQLGHFRKNGKYSDIIIKIGAHRVACHKVILAAFSTHMDDLLQCAKKEGDVEVLELRTVNPKVKEAIIDFLYTGKIAITTENVKAICECCDELQLQELKRVADKFIADRIEPSNALGLYTFAKTYKLDLTLDAAFQCMLTKLSDILRLALDAEYKELSKDSLIQFIADDELVINEALVFQLVKRWTEADVRTREHVFEQVLEYVRLPLCTPAFLCSEVEKCSFAKTDKCNQLIHEAKNYHLLPDYRDAEWNPRMRVRQRKRLVLLGGAMDDDVNSSPWVLKSGDSSWREMTTFSSNAKWVIQACTVGKGVLVSGGRTKKGGSQYSSQCLLLCTDDWSWKSFPSLQEARSDHSMVTTRDRVYVIGGYNGHSLASCEMLDENRKKWVNVAPLIAAVCNAACVSYKSKVYIFGGRNNNKANQCFHPTTNTWTNKADLPLKSHGAAAAVVQDKIYVIGGVDDICLGYDPSTDVWATLNPPQKQHRWMSAVTEWKGKLLIGGGVSGAAKCTDVVEEYDIEHNTWAQWSPPMPKALHAHCLLTVEL